MQDFKKIVEVENSRKTVLLAGVIFFFALATGVLGFVLGRNNSAPIASSPAATIPEKVTNSPIASVNPSQNPANASVTPTKDPYAGWKTYTNNNFKLSFKYPSDFNITENRDVITVSGSSKGTTVNSHYSISISKDASKKDSLDFLNSGDSGDIRDSKKDQYITVANQQYLFKYYYSGEGGPNTDGPGSWDEYWETYIAEVNNNKFLVNISQNSSTTKDQNGKILESFSATEKEISEGKLLLKSFIYFINL